MSEKIEILLEGDCKDVLIEIPDNSVDLIITSPPYADQRKGIYDGVHSDKYVEWFIPISEQLLRVLKPTGTFILNIKEKVIEGERSIYVIELIIAMRKQGWLWTEEFIWHKKNCFPGKWSNRFRDAWERLLQFNKNKNFVMYQNEVMIEPTESTKKRAKNLKENDLKRMDSATENNFSRNISTCVNREMVYPSNVLYLATECSNKNHSAVFPKELPEWFIKLFTKENDIVLDPFAGSGTTGIVAKKLNRDFILIEKKKEYCELIKKRLEC